MKKPSKKVILIILIALVVLIASASIGFIVLSGKNSKPKTLDEYRIGEDSVSSISVIVGERELPEILETVDGELTKIKYNYENLTTGTDDVKQYVTFLTEQRGFLPIIEYDAKKFPVAGYISLASPSSIEGNIFQIDIDYTPDDYKIIVSNPVAEMPKPKPKDDAEPFTRESALQFLDTYTPKELGIPLSVSNYMAIFDPGQTSVYDKDTYGVSIYKRGVGLSNEIVGKFYIPVDRSCVYKYDVNDNTFNPIIGFNKTAKETIDRILSLGK